VYTSTDAQCDLMLNIMTARCVNSWLARGVLCHNSSAIIPWSDFTKFDYMHWQCCIVKYLIGFNYRRLAFGSKFRNLLTWPVQS
jgi:hypothetical protein